MYIGSIFFILDAQVPLGDHFPPGDFSCFHWSDKGLFRHKGSRIGDYATFDLLEPAVVRKVTASQSFSDALPDPRHLRFALIDVSLNLCDIFEDPPSLAVFILTLEKTWAMNSTIVPILGLSADIWSSIGAFLQPNDAVRLISMGSAALSKILSLGVRHLRLDWTTSRYVDFDEAFKIPSSFHRITDLVFRAKHALYMWKSPSAPLLTISYFPPTLRHLHLRFHGAYLALQLDLKSLTLLETLIINDMSEAQFCPPIELRRLPPSLTHLSISRCNGSIVLQHFSLLPPNLLTLELNFDASSISEKELEREYKGVHEDSEEEEDEDEEDGTDGEGDGLKNEPTLHPLKSILPPLPDSITRICLKANYSSWHVDFATLPSSLTSFVLISHETALQSADISSRDSTLDLTHAVDRLPFLEALDVSRLYLTFKEVATLIPPTVTLLNVRLEGVDQTFLKEAVEFTKPRLTELDVGHSSGIFDEAVMHGDHDFTRLHRVSLHLQIGLKDIVLPKSLEYVDYLASNFDSLPSGLKNVSFRWLPKDVSLNLGASLTCLYTPYHHEIEPQHILALPPSLSRLCSSIPTALWDQLVGLILTPGRLPALTNVTNHSLLPLRSLNKIPSVLKSLSLELDAISLQDAPNDSVLKALRESCLTNLELRSDLPKPSPTVAVPQMDTTIKILNALPSSLLKLTIYTPCVPSLHWPVTLPCALKELFYQFPRGQLAVHYEEGTEVAESRLPIFQLPATVRHFSSTSNEFTWRMTQLPPYLSTLILPREGSIEEYIASRTPPSHLSGYTLCKM